MERKFLINLILAITSLILSSCVSTAVVVDNPVSNIDKNQDTDLAEIQASTILIVAQSSASFKDLSIAYGIGTLVEYQGDAFLVTHNHWGNVLENDLATIELRDAHNQLIQPMYAGTFKDLIVYQDPGTLVLRAPLELLENMKPVRIKMGELLEIGTVVQMAYRQPSDRASVAVSDAEIVQVSTFEGKLVYEFRSLNGQVLQKGDSGGGVWHNHKLVGNNWAILVGKRAEDVSSEVGQITPTASSEGYTALLPDWTED